MRLTALYSGLFLLCGAGLLAITYLLVDHATAIHAVATRSPGGAPGRGAAVKTHLVDLHQLLIQSGVALAIMTVVSIMLGWMVAGRVLRPLRAMTAMTRRISEQSLHQRLALDGPRDELTELADTIDGLLARLESAFDAQRLFVANASHELRTPMATMRASLDVAMAKPMPVPEHIVVLEGRLRREFDRMEQLLEALLSLARSQYAVVEEGLTSSLDQIVSEALEHAAQDIASTQLAVDLNTAGDLSVSGSELLLTRMVENVIENAISHNEPGGWISIDVTADGPTVCLVVENGGAILSQREVDLLTQPFTRLGVPRTGSLAGAGLGLSIVASITQAHGGTVDLQARHEGGLRVLVELPAAIVKGA